MAKKAVIEETAQEVIEQPPVADPVPDPVIEETAQEARLLSVNLIKCDGITYQPGDEFPFDHPEAERLFTAGVLTAG